MVNLSLLFFVSFVCLRVSILVTSKSNLPHEEFDLDVLNY